LFSSSWPLSYHLVRNRKVISTCNSVAEHDISPSLQVILLFDIPPFNLPANGIRPPHLNEPEIVPVTGGLKINNFYFVTCLTRGLGDKFQTNGFQPQENLLCT